MGYSTTYKMKWTAVTWKPQPLCSHPKASDAKFCATCGKPNACLTLDDVVGFYIESHEEMAYALEPDGSTRESCKWYKHLEDLKKMSEEIRGVLFHLEGKGEEAANGDIWDAFALDGQLQKHEAQIVRVTEPKPWPAPPGSEDA